MQSFITANVNGCAPVLKQRIILKFLIEDGLAVKYQRFTENRRPVGDPVSLMRTMEDQRLDEFMICDLGTINPTLVARMTEAAYCPVTAAGGIHKIEQVDELIRNCGVDKVVVKDDRLGWKIAEKYGSQAAVMPIDYYGALRRGTAPDWAGELLLTSVDRDGMGTGFDLDALRGTYNIPVVLAGGCGKLVHVKDAFAAGASGVVISSMFAFTDKSPIKLRSWLASQGSNVRVA